MTGILLFIAGSYLLAFSCANNAQGANILELYFVKVLPIILSLYVIVYSLGQLK